MREAVLIYQSFAKASESLAAEEYAELWKAIFKYALEDEETDSFSSPLAEAIYTMAKPQIDANTKRYVNGKKGGRPTNEEKNRRLLEEKTIGYESEEPNKNNNKNKNDNNNKKENIKEKEKAPAEPKHARGENKKVKLTDKEYERLITDYGEAKANEAIAYLDDYIARKGYTARDHNLTIRKWVFDAVEEEKQRKARIKNNRPQYTVFEHRPDNADLEKELLANG